ncbi:hypothetical protein Zmor_006168 [Zophobas morio]|uniref:Nuclease HARBI1 n=1 Tax=Zophobas morio TaxID=2755281 RepID=A0AA38IZ32_9CUCU|nr:hypothetical protein Zmor_006168 [Zophobas morio]
MSETEKTAPTITEAAFSLPAFWDNQPELWFAMAEARFSTFQTKIVKKETKYNHVLIALPPYIAAEVTDQIVTPDPDLPYTRLKQAIIARTSLTETQRLKQLLSCQELGSRKPTQLLRHMKSLTNGGDSLSPYVNETALRELFLQQMPTNNQPTLISLTTDQLAEVADKIIEAVPAATMTAIGAKEEDQRSASERNDAIGELTRQVQNLTARLERYEGRGRSISQTRARSRSRNRQRQNSAVDRKCWLRKEDVEDIEELIEPLLNQRQRLTGLTTRTKLLAALRFFAGGSYQLDVGGNYTVGLSQPSVSRAIHEIIDAFNTPFMLNRFIKFPQTIEELTNIRQRFFNKFGLPGIIGCIDGTHVSIVTPIENEHLYINRKRYHSLNVQIICDEELKITNVNARFPGSTHDSFVWQNSNIFTFLRDLPREHRGSYYLLGDSGYPLRASLYRKTRCKPKYGAANIVTGPGRRDLAVPAGKRPVFTRVGTPTLFQGVGVSLGDGVLKRTGVGALLRFIGVVWPFSRRGEH